MELLYCIIMDKVRLKVLTVPVFDPVTLQEHIAYSVIHQDGDKVQCAPGWTLREAIETFCKMFHVERGRVSIQRPFFPQRDFNHE